MTSSDETMLLILFLILLIPVILIGASILLCILSTLASIFIVPFSLIQYFRYNKLAKVDINYSRKKKIYLILSVVLLIYLVIILVAILGLYCKYFKA